jgi:hypothetical protein
MTITDITRASFVTVLSVLLFAAAGNAPVYANMIQLEDPGYADGFFHLPGILPSGKPDFDHKVNTHVVRQGNNGSMLIVTGMGGNHYFNVSDEESYPLTGGYVLKARFDSEGNLLDGNVKITGSIMNDDGMGSMGGGKLFEAELGSDMSDTDYAFTSDLIGFNTSNITCSSVISQMIPGGCEQYGSVYLPLDEGDFDGLMDRYYSRGRAVTSMPSAIPVPAAVWLFGSGLIGLVGMARRCKR